LSDNSRGIFLWSYEINARKIVLAIISAKKHGAGPVFLKVFIIFAG
jgi:hypothetical protein